MKCNQSSGVCSAAVLRDRGRDRVGISGDGVENFLGINGDRTVCCDIKQAFELSETQPSTHLQRHSGEWGRLIIYIFYFCSVLPRLY